MFWPFAPFRLAVPGPMPNGQAGYAIFPSTTCNPAWVELALYLGGNFRTGDLRSPDAEIEAERLQYASDLDFYKHSERYLYHLTSYFTEGWKRPAYGMLFTVTGFYLDLHVLDYGCGIGSDGLYFLEAGMRVSFADYVSPSTAYLEWRLDHRMHILSRIYDIETATMPDNVDIVWCMDVLEHLPPDQHQDFLTRLMGMGPVVIMNFVDDPKANGIVHYPVDVEGLTTWLEGQVPIFYRDMNVQRSGGRVRFLTFGEGTLRNGMNIWNHAVTTGHVE
jgi:SAM-dependent methyltransferase